MGRILIRDLKDEAIEAHRRRAKAHGHSLEQELRTVIESAAAYSSEEKLAIAEYAQSLTPVNARDGAVDIIRDDRDR
jgi:plasmid stability protein